LERAYQLSQSSYYYPVIGRVGVESQLELNLSGTIEIGSSQAEKIGGRSSNIAC
jgi:hypothetical protein